MTKARARERAKARKKLGKQKHDTDKSGREIPKGHFDPDQGSTKGPGANANVKNFGPAKRGSARSG